MDVVFSKIQEIPPEHYDEELAKLKRRWRTPGCIWPLWAPTPPSSLRATLTVPPGSNTMKQAIDAAAYLGADTVCSLIAQGFYDPALYNIMTRKEAWDMVVSGVRSVPSMRRPRT